LCSTTAQRRQGNGRGNDFEEAPFSLATNGTTQALIRRSSSPCLKRDLHTSYSSQEKLFDVPNSKGQEKFEVHNYEDNYLGSASLQSATTYSDNSVYAELALGGGCTGCNSPHIRGGPAEIAKTANAMGIRTPVSDNPAMVLGAPLEGFTPLEMAYAFTTLSTTASGRRHLDTFGNSLTSSGRWR
jgi:membrane peptidoglycan carboxypeptidase